MKQKITIVGLGPGGEGELTLAALKALKQGEQVLLRTGRHGLVPFLQKQNLSFTTLDAWYDEHMHFDKVYGSMVKQILSITEDRDLVLGVPGHPLVGERLVLELLKAVDHDTRVIDIIPGITTADNLLALVRKAGVQGLKILVAAEVKEQLIDARWVTVVTDIHNSLLASELKLALLRVYPSDISLHISHLDSFGQPICIEVPLYQLDHYKQFDHTSCIYIPALTLRELESYDFNHLAEIMEMLRAPGGCPWDREQTHGSLKQYLIEETYEVLEAIDLNDMDKLMEELGDLLLQVFFHAEIARERGEFDIMDVTTGVCQKMIDRHTHIFGDVKVDSADEVVSNWEAIKKQEKGLQSHTQVLRDIPSNLPSLMRGYKVQKKAALVGFDWDRVEDAFDKVDEELGELKEVYKGTDQEKIIDELGDLLFAVVNVARFLKIQPELALTATIEKFIRRFEYIEKNAGRPLEQMTLMEMDTLWNEAKVVFRKEDNV